MTNILVVDDNDQNLYMIQVFLKSHGYEVVTAKNGKEALEKARKERPDLIISDILMPVMDGFTLIREWKTDDQLKQVPFIFYTATYTDQKDEEYALSLGADNYIRKPMDPDLFLKQIFSLTQTSQHPRMGVQKPALKEEGYKLYSARLVQKLEKKMVDLEQEIQKRKSIETDLKNARQEWKMESIGNLAGGIAHDFNNILASIIGYTELSLAEVETGTLLKDNLEEIYNAGKRARDLVKQILTFARKTDEKTIPLRPDKIGLEVLKLLRPTTPATIDIQSEFKTASHVMASPTQIHQVFMNLCTNAIQSMENIGGTLRVNLWEETIDPGSKILLGLSPGNYMVLEISDTGQGIPKNHIEQIFDPYFTTKGLTSGTGLGLSMVHGIVKSTGGEIMVTSQENQGSAFKVYLPLLENQDETKTRTETPVPMGSERILFVDDEPAIAEVGAMILTRLGYKVTPKIDSREALETFVSNPHEFDLVVTDMTMPQMTGEALARELLRIRSDIPVILLTGHHKKISQDLIQEVGIKAFAHKPLMLAQLARIVRDVLDGRTPEK